MGTQNQQVLGSVYRLSNTLDQAHHPARIKGETTPKTKIPSQLLGYSVDSFPFVTFLGGPNRDLYPEIENARYPNPANGIAACSAGKERSPFSINAVCVHMSIVIRVDVAKDDGTQRARKSISAFFVERSTRPRPSNDHFGEICNGRGKGNT